MFSRRAVDGCHRNAFAESFDEHERCRRQIDQLQRIRRSVVRGRLDANESDRGYDVVRTVDGCYGVK